MIIKAFTNQSGNIDKDLSMPYSAYKHLERYVSPLQGRVTDEV